MSPEVYLAYALACLVIILVPGPTVTLIIASSMRHGVRAGLLNVAGTQVGIALMIAIVGIGLGSMVGAMGHWFEWVRFIGAAYLVWIGVQMIRTGGRAADSAPPVPPRGGFFLQGFVVLLSNPKVLVFFGAFIPQFVDMAQPHGPQVALLGATFMVIAALSDGVYALLAGRAGRLLSARRVRLVSRLSGGVMIGGGLWLALSRAR